MRALWTAATGMKTHQLGIDTIANNLANVNTTSYKTQRAEFKDLFYTTLKRNNIVDDQGNPVNLEVGHGSMPSATRRDFKPGSFIATEGTYDLAIEGDGFFSIRMPNNELRYTRDGGFKLSAEANGARLVTSEGYTVLDENNNAIYIGDDLTEISIDTMGNIAGLNQNGQPVQIARLKLVDFTNPNGLSSEGANLYSASQSSGAEIPINAQEMETTINQGYLEASNVQVIDEMVNMITAQRAYELTSKAIQTSDEMMQIVNNLKR